jgi:hypothetical protein
MKINERLFFSGIFLFSLLSICLYVFNTKYSNPKSNQIKTKVKIIEKSDFVPLSNDSNKEEEKEEEEELDECDEASKMNWRRRVGFFLMPECHNENNILELASSLEKYFCSSSNDIYVHYFIFTTLSDQKPKFNLTIQRDYTLLQMSDSSATNNINRQVKLNKLCFVMLSSLLFKG